MPHLSVLFPTQININPSSIQLHSTLIPCPSRFPNALMHTNRFRLIPLLRFCWDALMTLAKKRVSIVECFHSKPPPFWKVSTTGPWLGEMHKSPVSLPPLQSWETFPAGSGLVACGQQVNIHAPFPQLQGLDFQRALLCWLIQHAEF